MRHAAMRAPPSTPELTMVLAGSNTSPWCSWARINAALSELIDANRQRAQDGREGGTHPRWYRRVCPVALPHTAPPIAPAPHAVGGIDIAPPLSPRRLPPPLQLPQHPYSLPRDAGGFTARRSRRSLPRGAGGFTAWHEAFASLGRPVKAMGRIDLTHDGLGVRAVHTQHITLGHGRLR